MKTIKLLTLLAIFIGFSSCSDNDDDDPTLQVETEAVANLYAPQLGGQGQPISGDYTKFNFSTGAVTTSTTDWDIAFRGTDIILNGGVSSGGTDEPARNGNASGQKQFKAIPNTQKTCATISNTQTINMKTRP